MSRRILLVGATGAFGSRLAGMLSCFTDIELMFAARRLEGLTSLMEALRASGARATLRVQPFDRAKPETLAALDLWLVIDASGPFQECDYALALAAVRAGAHYIDLSDGRAFVAGFVAALSRPASAAGVLAVTGASSTPALSHAALHRLTEGWLEIDKVVVGIMPGARAPRGVSIMRAILGYAGQPLRVFREGRWSMARGWTGLRRLDVPMLGRRWASICETPDLDLLPERFPIKRTALFLAGLELAPMHLGLSMLTLLVRLGVVSDLRPLARPLRAIAGLLAPFGTDRGGMIVEARGISEEGRAIRSRWSLWAEANAGPNTPAAPAAALTRALVEGREVRRGAHVCAGFLDLDAILRELAAFPICTRVDESYPQEPNLFRSRLGRRFDQLPAAVKTVHGQEEASTFAGHAVARAGRSPAAIIVGRIFGLPGSGQCPATVSIVPNHNGETWTRRFGQAQFRSQIARSDRLGMFEERFGPLHFVFDLQVTPTGVVWHLIGWNFATMPLPPGVAPMIRARADDRDGSYRFRVVVAHRWLGLLFAYRGTLDAPAQGRSTSVLRHRDDAKDDHDENDARGKHVDHLRAGRTLARLNRWLLDNLVGIGRHA